VEEFTVSPSLFGLVIGQNGSRINSVQAMSGIMSANIDTQSGLVRIVGESVEEVRSARALLEFVEVEFPITGDLANWVRGKGNKTIQQLEGLSKAHHIRIVAEKEVLAVHIAGTKEAVKRAQLLVEQHIEYRQEWDKADQEQKLVLQQLSELRRGQQRAPGAMKEEGEARAETPHEKQPSDKRWFRKQKWAGKKKEGQKTDKEQNDGHPGANAESGSSRPQKQTAIVDTPPTVQ